MAERLNTKRIISLLECLGEETTGTRDDKLARLDAKLVERNLNINDALKIIVPYGEADIHESITGNVEKLELNDDINPEDSISQVGYPNLSVKSKVRSSRSGVIATNSLILARPSTEIKKLEMGGRAGISKSVVEAHEQLKKFVSDTHGSQASSCVSVTSRTSRISQTSMKRREAAVQREIDAARTAKLEEARELKKKQQLARVDKEQRQLDAKQKELKEKLEEIELEEEIKRLEKEADMEARKVAEEAWARFEEMDMGFAQDLHVPLETKNRTQSQEPLKVRRQSNQDRVSVRNKSKCGWRASSVTQVNTDKDSPPLGR